MLCAFIVIDQKVTKYLKLRFETYPKESYGRLWETNM